MQTKHISLRQKQNSCWILSSTRFIRIKKFSFESVSNAWSPEKIRHLQNTNNVVAFNDSKLEIKITTDAESKTITIEDSSRARER